MMKRASAIIPEENYGKGEVVQLLEVLVLDPFCDHSVLACSLEHVVRFAAVPRDATLEAWFPTISSEWSAIHASVSFLKVSE